MNDIQPITNALSLAKTPAQSKAVEAMASAAKAYAKEQNDYEMLVQAMHLWVMARRKTTELIMPSIQHGGNFQGHGVVTLNDFGLTKMQWNRRCKELEISEADIETYFDDCIAKAWEPSLFGLHLWKERGGSVNSQMEKHETCTCPTCGQEHRKAK